MSLSAKEQVCIVDEHDQVVGQADRAVMVSTAVLLSIGRSSLVATALTLAVCLV